MPAPHFLRELRRRHIFRVAAVYAVTAWLLLQLAAIVLPTFDVPHWVLKALIWIFVLFFPVAILLAWAFEMTPGGVRRTEPAHSEEARSASTSRRIGRTLDFTIIAILAVAVGVLAWRLSEKPPASLSHHVVATSASARPVGTTSTAVTVIPAKSIAVLPFENLSADKINTYFASGIQDEILTSLARIGDLKVISRTSTRRYVSHPDNIAEIGRQLGVAYILEGSVQKFGNRVRINVQLIQAESDDHLWGETYDRTLNDVFAVQSEVAQKIAGSLQVRLTRDERAALAIKLTDDPVTYEAWFKARTLMLGSAFERVNLDRVVDALQSAVTLDPHFARAWAELSIWQLWLYSGGFDASPTRLAAAKSALDRALALAPDLPQVEWARAVYLYRVQRDFAGALAIMQKVRRLVPNDAEAWYFSALLERRFGQFDATMTDFERARSLNPNDVRYATEYGLTLYLLRRFGEAVPILDAGLALHPDDPALLLLRLDCAWNLHGLAAGERFLATVKSSAPPVVAMRARQALYERDYARAATMFRQAIVSKDDAQMPSVFLGYIPAHVEWQLRLALSEQHSGASAAAADVYRQVQTQGKMVLAKKQGNRNVDAAWHAALAWVEAGLGRQNEAVAQARRATAVVSEASDTWEGPVWQAYLARTYAMNGDAGHALPLLKHLMQDNKVSLIDPANLRLDPVWDPIRKDPRFQTLLKRRPLAAAAGVTP